MSSNPLPPPTGRLGDRLAELRASVGAKRSRRGLAGEVERAMLRLFELLLALLAKLQDRTLAVPTPVRGAIAADATHAPRRGHADAAPPRRGGRAVRTRRAACAAGEVRAEARTHARRAAACRRIPYRFDNDAPARRPRCGMPCLDRHGRFPAARAPPAGAFSKIDSNPAARLCVHYVTILQRHRPGSGRLPLRRAGG